MQTISDIRGKRLTAYDINSLGSGLGQWAELRKLGIDMFVDSLQVNFAQTQDLPLMDLQLGNTDVAMVRQGILQGLLGNPVREYVSGGAVNFTGANIRLLTQPGFSYSSTVRCGPT